MSIDFEVYHNPRSVKQCNNVAMFEKIVDRYPWIKFSQPNPENAPWHVQGIIRYEGGRSILVNFWPHSGKAQREDCKAVSGYEQIRAMISECIDDSQDEEESLIE